MQTQEAISTGYGSGAKLNYLNNGTTLKSWLLTKDHKRIAIMYLISVSAFFLMGGLYAATIRLELLTPASDLVESGTYNRVFTQHGVLMIFFFLIPSIPAILGNFLIPIMIGAKDLALPRINLLSLYIYWIGGGLTLFALMQGGVDTGWTFYTPYSFVDPYGPQFHRHDPHDAGSGNDLVPYAALCLGTLCDQPGNDTRNAGGRDHDPFACSRACRTRWYF